MRSPKKFVTTPAEEECSNSIDELAIKNKDKWDKKIKSERYLPWPFIWAAIKGYHPC